MGAYPTAWRKTAPIEYRTPADAGAGFRRPGVRPWGPATDFLELGREIASADPRVTPFVRREVQTFGKKKVAQYVAAEVAETVLIRGAARLIPWVGAAIIAYDIYTIIRDVTRARTVITHGHPPDPDAVGWTRTYDIGVHEPYHYAGGGSEEYVHTDWVYEDGFPSPSTNGEVIVGNPIGSHTIAKVDQYHVLDPLYAPGFYSDFTYHEISTTWGRPLGNALNPTDRVETIVTTRPEPVPVIIEVLKPGPVRYKRVKDKDKPETERDYNPRPVYPHNIPLGNPPVVDVDPWSSPLTVPPLVITTPGARPQRQPVTSPRTPPRDPDTKERKLKGGKHLKFVTGLFSGVTESIDFIESLYEALPKKIRDQIYARVKRGNKNAKVDPKDMLEALWKHWDKLDVNEALKNIAINQLEDAAIGKLGKKAQIAAKPILEKLGRPVGFGFGPAL